MVPLLLVICMLMNDRLEDDEALRAKVDEALSVYDEYMKNKGTEGEAAGEAPKPKEAATEESTEENKS